MGIALETAAFSFPGIINTTGIIIHMPQAANMYETQSPHPVLVHAKKFILQTATDKNSHRLVTLMLMPISCYSSNMCVPMCVWPRVSYL